MAFKQSYRGYVREHLVRIEEMIAFGHSHAAIRATLLEEGFEATLSSFRDALMHARKWKRKINEENLTQVVKEKKAVMAQVSAQMNQKEISVDSQVTKTDQTNDVDQFFKRKSLFRKTKP